jgi:hypothetical protein
MPDAQTVLDHQYLEMRWRALSLAADLDRIQRAEGGNTVLDNDPRMLKLRRMFAILCETRTESPDRAEQVQMILSDMSPVPE